MKKILPLLVCFIFMLSQVFAQEGNLVTGTIKDNMNRPIGEASVLLKGSNLGTVSDGAGNFEIRISTTSATLIFSAVGYEDQEIAVQNLLKLECQQIRNRSCSGIGTVIYQYPYICNLIILLQISWS